MKKSIACGACRSSKRKCIHSGGPPCTRCRDRGDECVFPPKGTSFIFRRSRLERHRDEVGAGAGSQADSELIRAGNLATTDPFGFLTDEVKNSYLRCSYKWSFHHIPNLLIAIRERRLDPLLVWAMLAITVRFSQAAPPGYATQVEASNTFAAHARSLVLSLVDQPTVHRAQVLLMLTGHSWGAGEGRRAWVYLGMAVRMAQVLGLFEEPPPATTREDFIDAEERRRTAWACFLMDSLLSGGKGRDRMLSGDKMRIQLPCESDSFNFGQIVLCERLDGSMPDGAMGTVHGSLGIVANSMRVADVWGAVAKWACTRHDNTVPPWQPQSEFQMLLSRLELWKNSLPERLRYELFLLRAGPWSDPVYANSSGFDPSLFHDDDGRKWFNNMTWDHRARPHLFSGIFLQEFDPKQGKLVGPKENIFKGTDLAYVEGSHLYKRNGWYYLSTAEDGTGYTHAMTLARSRSIWGPYEVHPQKHVVTSKDAPNAALQRAGHADIVDTPDGKTYIVHLTGRPVTQKRRSVLGRETAIQEAYWGDDDWLCIKNGPVPSLHVDLPAARDDTEYWKEKRYTFTDKLHIDFQWLRTPEPERIFNIKNNQLSLIGRESIGSWFEQALVARRQTHFSYDAETVITYSPDDERQFAGLTAYYCRFNFFYLTVTASASGQRELQILSSEESFPIGRLERPFAEPVEISSEGKVRLAVSVRAGSTLQFYYALEGQELKEIGPVYDASILSDECGGHPKDGSFTGGAV
ncbi:hypothetical protein H9Q69_010314 [Fusarium xylarioides]|nr:hypothetical protein H9Q69_010314 [Fusarium xylarioides]